MRIIDFRGQVEKIDRITGHGDKRMLDGMLELAHIAGPGVRHHPVQGVSCNTLDLLPCGQVEIGDEVVREDRNILLPLAKRGNGNFKYLDAIAEVFTDRARCDEPRNVVSGSRDEQPIDLERVVSSPT